MAKAVRARAQHHGTVPITAEGGTRDPVGHLGGAAVTPHANLPRPSPPSRQGDPARARAPAAAERDDAAQERPVPSGCRERLAGQKSIDIDGIDRSELPRRALHQQLVRLESSATPKGLGARG